MRTQTTPSQREAALATKREMIGGSAGSQTRWTKAAAAAANCGTAAVYPIEDHRDLADLDDYALVGVTGCFCNGFSRHCRL